MPLVRADCIVPGDLIELDYDSAPIIAPAGAIALVISNRDWTPPAGHEWTRCIDLLVNAGGSLSVEMLLLTPEEQVLNVVFRP